MFQYDQRYILSCLLIAINQQVRATKRCTTSNYAYHEYDRVSPYERQRQYR